MDQGTVLWIIGAVFGGGVLFAQLARARSDISKLDDGLADMKTQMAELRTDVRRLLRQP